MSSVVVKPVINKRDREDFLRVPFEVFKNDPNWVAPLFLERYEHLDPRKNPYFEHAEVQLFIAYRDGKPAGRISVQDDALRLATHKDNKGMFGFLDAIDDRAVFAALLEAARNWLRSRGRVGMLGPFNFSINDELGLLINGFDTPPNMMMAHAPRHASQHVEALGAKKAKDVIAYHYKLDEPPALAQRVTRRVLASPDYSIRPLNLSDIKSEVRLLVDIFNDAWSRNWGFVPWTESELDKLGKDMKMLINSNYGCVASYKGEPSAFVITLPNLNDWIKGMNGKILPINWAKLAYHVIKKRPTSFRMPLMGVRRKFHGTATGSMLATIVIENVRAYQSSRGGQTAELSWILEDNLPVRKMIESFNGVPYKTYRIYEISF